MKTRGTILVFALVTGSWLLVSCDGGENQAHPPASSTTTTTETSTSTTGTPTTASPTTTNPACGSLGGVTDVRVDYPNRMSSLVGKDVRTGTHLCYERFVVELQTTNQANPRFPGYWVRYATGPVTLDPKGEVITVRGGAALLVSMGSWTLNTENVGYHGPNDVFPTNVTAIREYRLTENFEGLSTWAVGVDHVRNFRVTVLNSPPRLVVDIQT